uniref:Manganese-dependent ADP-ribose/CDP-alcohol diphosphatase n=1 Tax=Oryzias latipes TaxID=8090 RepID=A0A3P9JN74_ORYLA
MGECRLQEPLFTFGVIADVQYADIDDGQNYSRTRDRYYRSSLQLLSNAQDAWREARLQPLFVLQLGDLIDGFNKPRGASERALDAALRRFETGPAPVHHVWGNHEFYNFSRSALLHSPLNSRLHADSGAGAAPVRPDIYAYRFTPVPGFTFVVLDAYDVSLLGREESSEEYRSAMELIRKYNQNQDLNCPPAFEDLRQRFTRFNGGFSREQLDWLDSVLTSADEKQERVTIASHLPVHPFSTDAVCLAWNFEELLTVIHSHKCVVCYMAGHAHDGGYHHDKDTGVHHLTLDGVIETPPYSDAFGIVSVYADRMELKGSGRVLDRLFLF